MSADDTEHNLLSGASCVHAVQRPVGEWRTVALRRKNQLTLPDEVARRMGVEVGNRLLITFDEEAGEAHVRRAPESYAGALRGLYGTPEEVRKYLREERRSWSRP